MPTQNNPSPIDGSLVMLLVVTVLATAFLISQLI
jgi:flagellin-like protein